MAKLIGHLRELHEDGERRMLKIFDPGSSRRATDSAPGVLVEGDFSFLDKFPIPDTWYLRCLHGDLGRSLHGF